MPAAPRRRPPGTPRASTSAYLQLSTPSSAHGAGLTRHAPPCVPTGHAADRVTGAGLGHVVGTGSRGTGTHLVHVAAADPGAADRPRRLEGVARTLAGGAGADL